MDLLLRLLPAVTAWSIFAYTVFKVGYPQSLAQANFFQLVYFFLPLFLGLIFTVSLFLKSYLISTLISLGAVFLLLLQGLRILNLVSASLIAIATFLFISYFKKKPKTKPSKILQLTSPIKIPKLRLLKEKK